MWDAKEDEAVDVRQEEVTPLTETTGEEQVTK